MRSAAPTLGEMSAAELLDQRKLAELQLNDHQDKLDRAHDRTPWLAAYHAAHVAALTTRLRTINSIIKARAVEVAA